MTRPNVGDRFPVGAVGDAALGDVLEGKTFSSEPEGVDATGTMPNQGAVNITPGTSNQSIPEGYHNGNGVVDGDSGLVPDNIKDGTSIFGVSGNVVPGEGSWLPYFQDQSKDHTMFESTRYFQDEDRTCANVSGSGWILCITTMAVRSTGVLSLWVDGTQIYDKVSGASCGQYYSTQLPFPCFIRFENSFRLEANQPDGIAGSGGVYTTYILD